jgi:two-component system cell cycle sensor histidine kinase/response regulator CckA
MGTMENEKAKSEAILEAIGDSVVIISPEFKVLYQNRISRSLIGNHIDEQCYKAFRGKEVFCEACPVKKSLREGVTHTVESRNCIDGEIVNLEITASPLRDAAGKIIAGIEVIRNITERKRLEEKLQLSEESYRDLVERSPYAIYIHTEGKIVFANATGAQLLGADQPEELYGREALDFVHPDNRETVHQRMKQIQQTEKVIPMEELLIVRVDGTTLPVEVAAIPFTYHGENAVQVIARDISERKKMQDELLKVQKLESLGILAGGIAHDFNNILTAILGNLSMARMQLDPSHAIARRLAECEKATLQAGELTRQLLTFSRGGAPVKKLIAPAALIRTAATFVLRGTSARSVIDLADDLWCLEADGGQINQVLHNLLINASHAMPGGGEVSVRAVNETLETQNLHQLPPGDYIRITVEDHGCGIARENLTRIFDPYFTTKNEGTGLGLASVYSIVRKHGGIIEVSSTIGYGTSFAIHLPASPGRLPDDEEVKADAGRAGSARVLLMDDEQYIREIATGILEYKGYEVESCADGREAVERSREARERNAPFAAIILDLTVPGGMGGKESAELIREIDPDAMLIVSSGYSNDPVVANYQQYGFSGAIAKPFNAATLVRELERVIPAAR